MPCFTRGAAPLLSLTLTLAIAGTAGAATPNASDAGIGTGSTALDTPLGDIAFDNGKTLALTLGYASSATHRDGDPADLVYALTDRGPNIHCDDSGKVVGVADFCKGPQGVDNDGKIFPMPGFTPQITAIRLGADADGHLTARVERRIDLKDSQGQPISGIGNPLTVTDTENGYDAHGTQLPLDPEGLDPEGLVRLADGSFWLSEEYGPSLVHAAADGTILQRVVPDNEVDDLKAANYPLAGELPTILSRRKLNRGAESLALSPDGRTLYFAMQSPLANPDKAAYKTSRNVRLFAVDLDDQGRFAGVAHEYLYRLDTPDTFHDADSGRGDANAKQSSVKVSEMSILPDGRLIVLERVSKTTKLYRIDASAATDLLGGEYDALDTRPTLAQVDDPASVGIVPVAKQLVFDSLTDAPALASKIEGVAVLDATHLLLANDNDFGIEGADSVFTVLPLVPRLSQ
ncbi:esterase-like activity of phytase family protein [Modicisalibacter coralii]|uniref:esterase-like activity of phytase family protein n=1 Tax=Modicisalibacter coralii TaxID=2304602 RepID=UPI00100B232B|nr:esterase-like activity of phytase family protein [Halomonas coralii]